MRIEELLPKIIPADESAMKEAENRWNSIAKPLYSLGLLEQAVIKMAGVFKTADFLIGRRAVVVMCADNGIVEEGVTQAGQEVTAIVARNMTSGETSVCCMANSAGAKVFPVNIGVREPLDIAGITDRLIMPGTYNMTKRAAMDRGQAEAAVFAGVDMVRALKEDGYDIIVTGEMGIGNTTTASAITSVLLDMPPAEVTGRGSGLSNDGLKRKIDAIERAIALNKPDKNDPMDVLCKVGGLDIAGITGLFLGGAFYGIPVVIDGFISLVAALTACRLCPNAAGYMLASHVSKEPASLTVLKALGFLAPIHADMCLGEGTGGVALLPLLDMAMAVYRNMSTFAEISVPAYKPQK